MVSVILLNGTPCTNIKKLAPKAGDPIWPTKVNQTRRMLESRRCTSRSQQPSPISRLLGIRAVNIEGSLPTLHHELLLCYEATAGDFPVNQDKTQQKTCKAKPLNHYQGHLCISQGMIKVPKVESVRQYQHVQLLLNPHLDNLVIPPVFPKVKDAIVTCFCQFCSRLVYFTAGALSSGFAILLR